MPSGRRSDTTGGDTSAADILTDGSYLVDVAQAHGDDFARNQVRMRTEHRFDVAVTRPTGVVKLELTTTP